MKILFLSIIFLCASQLGCPDSLCASEREFSHFQVIEQEYGGQFVTFRKVQEYVNRLSTSQVSLMCFILNDERSAAWAFSTGEIVLTRGLLFEISNEEELKKLFDDASKVIYSNSGTQTLTLQKIENGKSCDEFTKIFTSFWKLRETYSRLAEGYQALYQERYEDALCLAEDILDKIPDEPHLIGLLARSSAGVGNKSGALIELKKALRLNPHYYDFYLQRGLLFIQLGLLDGARTDLVESLKLYPTEEAYFALGSIALREGSYQEAIERFSHVMSEEATTFKKMAEVMVNPNEHLDISLSLNRRGYLMVTSYNISPFPLNRLVISVNSRNHDQLVKFGDQQIKPGKTMTVLTDIGPFDRRTDLSQAVELSAVSVKVNS